MFGVFLKQIRIMKLNIIKFLPEIFILALYRNKTRTTRPTME